MKISYFKYGTLFLFLISVLFLVWTQLCFLFKLDVSLAPVEPASQEKVYLVSYADGPEVFIKNQNTLALSAINKGVDVICMYRRKDLDPHFCQKNHEILSKNKGAGYWLWKPYLILKTLENAPDNAIILYLDSGLVITRPIQPLLDQLQGRDMVLIRWDPHPNQPSVSHVVQKRALRKINCLDEACLSGPHMWAAIGVYKNTANTRALVKKWLEACEDPECLIEGDTGPQHKNFNWHGHDEGLLSALAAQHGDHIATVSISRLLEELKIVYWSHRHPKGQGQSTLPYIFNKEDFPGEKFCGHVARCFYRFWSKFLAPKPLG